MSTLRTQADKETTAGAAPPGPPEAGDNSVVAPRAETVALRTLARGRADRAVWEQDRR